MGSVLDRIRFWVLAAIALLLADAVAGNRGVIALFALVSLQLLREFLTFTHTRRGDHWALIAAFFVVLPLQYVLIAIDWYGLSSVMIPVYAFLGLPIVSALRGDDKRYMERIAEVQWGLMTCVYCIAHVPGLLTLHVPGAPHGGLGLILLLALAVQGADIVYDIAEPRLSRCHQLEPLLREALAVATAGAVIGAGCAWATPFDLASAVAFGALVATLGLAGSLVMEAVKRDRGLEDWRRGDAFERYTPGLLDRCERLIFAAPVFFHLVRYWWTV